ncbi:MAG: TonB-dependent receptor [Sphingomonas sanxanigenens]|uniref:TonB-dependent receptor n=1 Tax=Sphingomonas sanxanigenens TaxID=397260 RepID=A0A2W5A4T7_9SPHN|nr:MAG: TonB-dependent receptor [Sphingomonas sanxanigenens]
MSHCSKIAFALFLAGSSAPLFAADASADATGDHHEESTDIVITALSRNRSDLLSGTSVLSGTDLAQSVRSTIGDTLSSLPGVSASSFGPSASRPILRGLQGDRVRILTDGIGSFDASGTSADHAVAIDTLTADRIEVLRGPSALLYGSGAIGGVVNVIDSRIPLKVPDEPVHVQLEGGYATAARERSTAGTVDVPLASNLVFHLDGSYLKSDDLDTGGYLLSAPLRAEAAGSADPGIQRLATLKGRLPNTAARTWDTGVGLAYIGSGGTIGFSYSHLDNLYGVPIRFSLDPNVASEQPRISLKQDRYDLRAEVDAGGGFLDKIRLRAGYGDYVHQELEPDGAVATTFYNKGLEGRLEFLQAKHGVWSGAFGGQVMTRDFNVVGDEKFLPKTATEQAGLFTVQQFDFGKLKAEAGVRVERTNAHATADADLGNADITRRFTSISGSVGASYAVLDGWRIGVNLTHSERAPTVEEMFANGPHGGTEAFEVGLPDARLEKSNGAELTFNGKGDGYTFELSGYYNRFSNFLYQKPTGAIEEDLPVYAMAQGKATHYGFEAQGNVDLFKIGEGRVSLDGFADYTHVTVRDYGPAPLIPPLRIQGGLGYDDTAWTGRVEVQRNFAQNRNATFETRTPGYTMVNAQVSWKVLGAGSPLTLRLAANNLFDVVARSSTSLLKDYAPLAGRDIRLGASVKF